MSYFSEILTKIMHIPGVGSKTAQKIVNEIKQQTLRDDEDIVSFIAYRNDPRTKVSEIVIRDAFHKGEKVLEETVKAGVNMVSIFDDDYPEKLRNFKPNPPVLINYKGNISSLKENPSCAVIGTRAPSENGFVVGVRVGELLAENKVVVISGLAKGCDTAGHVGCLNKNGKTIAVLAHGLKHLYPKENKKLADTILEKDGALISEYFYDQTARNNFFVERDRIQAGLSDNLFVVETDVKGGTMHTVKFALENQIKIFTYNHPEKYVNHDKAQGNQMLIRESKATPVGNPNDFNYFLDWIYSHQNRSHRHPAFYQQGGFHLDSVIKPMEQSDLILKWVESHSVVQKTEISDLDTPKTDSNPKKKKKRNANQIIKGVEKLKEDDKKNKSDNDSQITIWE